MSHSRICSMWSLWKACFTSFWTTILQISHSCGGLCVNLARTNFVSQNSLCVLSVKLQDLEMRSVQLFHSFCQHCWNSHVTYLLMWVTNHAWVPSFLPHLWFLGQMYIYQHISKAQCSRQHTRTEQHIIRLGTWEASWLWTHLHGFKLAFALFSISVLPSHLVEFQL